MCLSNLTTEKPLIAEKDIECYKVLEIYPDGRLTTPFRHQNVDLNKTYKSILEKSTHKYYCDIVDFGLHSMKTIKSAQFIIKNLPNLDYWRLKTPIILKYVIVKCTIPKGSKYFVGIFWNEKSYASDCLQYNKII